MWTKFDSIEAKKAAFFDLFALLEKDPEKAYTTEELKEIVMAYLKGLEAME